MGRARHRRQAKELGRDRTCQRTNRRNANQLAAARSHPAEDRAVAAAGAVAGGHGAAARRADEGAARRKRRPETDVDVGNVDFERRRIAAE